jgi:hypothetical protein
MLASGGRVTWLAHAYAIGIAGTILLTVAAVIRLRRLGAHDLPFKTPANVRLWGREMPMGLLGPAVIVAGCGLAMVATGDEPSVAAVALLVALASWFTLSARDAEPADGLEEPGTFDLLRSTRPLARSSRGASWQCARACSQSACAGSRSGCAPRGWRSRCRGDDRPIARHRYRERGCDREWSDQVRARVAGGSRVSGGAGRSSRASPDRACAQCGRRDCRHGDSSSLVRRLCRRIVEPLGSRPGAHVW